MKNSALALCAVLLLASASGLKADEVTLDCVAEPAQRVEIGSPVTGLLAAVTVSRGVEVEKGQILARLDSAVEEANVALATAQANAREALEAQRTRLTLAETGLQRARQLVNSGSVSKSRVEELEATVEIGRRDYETELHRLRLAAIELQRQEALLSRQAIRSPIDGYVLEQKLSAGEFVRQDSPIMTLVQTDPLHVEAYAPVALWERLSLGDSAVVLLDRPEKTRLDATVSVIDPVFDAASGTFGIRLALPNPENRLPAGQRCQVLLNFPS